MQFCIILLSALVLVSAEAYFYPAPGLRNVPQLSVYGSPIGDSASQQYYTRDDFGQYSYGYKGPLSAKQEVRTLDGITRGSYSYLDAEGKTQHVAYIADAGGFRVAATNLPRPLPVAEVQAPKPVEDTPEVAAARAQHLAAHKQATLRSSAAAVATLRKQHHFEATGSVAALPRPVEDTAEVAAAKDAFFERYEQEQLRHKLLRAKAVETLQLKPIVTSIPLASYKFVSPFSNDAFLPVA